MDELNTRFITHIVTDVMTDVTDIVSDVTDVVIDERALCLTWMMLCGIWSRYLCSPMGVTFFGYPEINGKEIACRS